jgi:hypothetical protein
MLLNTSGIVRPSVEDARIIFKLTPDEKRRLKPGLPVRKFIHPILRTTVLTRDHDIYVAAGWIDTTRRQAP